MDELKKDIRTVTNKLNKIVVEDDITNDVKNLLNDSSKLLLKTSYKYNKKIRIQNCNFKCSRNTNLSKPNNCVKFINANNTEENKYVCDDCFEKFVCELCKQKTDQLLVSNTGKKIFICSLHKL